MILLVLDGSRDNLILKSFLYANGEVLMQHNGNHTADKYFYLHDRPEKPIDDLRSRNEQRNRNRLT